MRISFSKMNVLLATKAFVSLDSEACIPLQLAYPQNETPSSTGPQPEGIVRLQDARVRIRGTSE